MTVEYWYGDHDSHLWSIDLVLVSLNSSDGATGSRCYVGEPGSLVSRVYDPGPPTGPIHGISPLMTIVIIQIVVLISFLVVRVRRSRGV